MWIKWTHPDGRVYFKRQDDPDETNVVVSRKMPPEGVHSDETFAVSSDEDAAKFESRFARAGKMDSGEINLKSEWIKVLCGERAYYRKPQKAVRRGFGTVAQPDILSLEKPAEGVREEQTERADSDAGEVVNTAGSLKDELFLPNS